MGGGQIYNANINNPLLDKIYLTYIDREIECDVFLPSLDSFEVVETLGKEEEEVEGEVWKYEFQVLKRKRVV